MTICGTFQRRACTKHSASEHSVAKGIIVILCGAIVGTVGPRGAILISPTIKASLQ